MLVVTRRVDESVVIGGNIVVTVLAIRGNKVSIGVVAPEGIDVNREEVQKRIWAELATAGGGS